MKRMLSTLFGPLAALLLLSGCRDKSQIQMTSDDDKKQDYLIVVPPWANWIKHDSVVPALQEWVKHDPTFTKQGITTLTFDQQQEIDIETAGGNAFVVKNLTQKQADTLRSNFRFPSRKKAVGQRRELFMSPNQIFAIDPTEISADEINEIKTLATSWAADSVVIPPNGSTKISIAQKTIPVLYVVDSGVQPIVPKTGTPTNYDWHPAFEGARAVGVTPTLVFQQGRMPPGMGTWPNTGGNKQPPWDNSSDNPLDFSNAAWVKPYLAGGNFSDPQKDVTPHGSKIASTAVGATVGLLGKFQTMDATPTPLKVKVESIRIVIQGSTTATAANAYQGILRAVAAHKAHPSESAVLMFAHRSLPASGFSETVEVGLWYAWTQGLVCVVSGGNEPGSAGYTSIHSPNYVWYNANGSLTSTIPTTPSRFDYTIPETSGASGYWPTVPDPNDENATVPRPTSPYLIVVGGNNVQFTGGTIGGTDGWRGSLGAASGSSEGPEIDIIGPTISVPCAVPTAASFGTFTGSSMTTGFVAGAALVYLATKDTAPTPDDVRNWLLPTSGANLTNSPCKQSTAPAYHAGNGGGHNSPYYGSALYGGNVPKLLIDSNTVW